MFEDWLWKGFLGEDCEGLGYYVVLEFFERVVVVEVEGGRGVELVEEDCVRRFL